VDPGLVIKKSGFAGAYKNWILMTTKPCNQWCFVCPNTAPNSIPAEKSKAFFGNKQNHRTRHRWRRGNSAPSKAGQSTARLLLYERRSTGEAGEVIVQSNFAKQNCD
jgi:hypothetical protein